MTSRNSHEPPGTCPLCGDCGEYEDFTDMEGHRIRRFECGMQFDCHVGLVDFFPRYSDGIRVVAREHFRRALEASPYAFA